MKDQQAWLEAEIARIDRNTAESQQIADESRKFIIEQYRIMEKQARFDAKYGWLRLPLSIMLIVICSAIVGILISLPEYLRMFGWVKP